HRGPVVAVDVPSGLDADKGIIGPCVRADHTVTFAFAKLGLVGAEEQAVAGSRGKTGAALLCGTAVLRSGAGLCTVAMPADAAALVEGRVPELMIEAVGDVQSLLVGKKAAAVGPGIARDDAARDRIRALATSELPLVVDADALNAIAADRGLLPRRGSPTVLTPHPGEAARLLGATVGAVQED